MKKGNAQIPNRPASAANRAEALYKHTPYDTLRTRRTSLAPPFAEIPSAAPFGTIAWHALSDHRGWLQQRHGMFEPLHGASDTAVAYHEACKRGNLPLLISGYGPLPRDQYVINLQNGRASETRF